MRNGLQASLVLSMLAGQSPRHKYLRKKERSLPGKAHLKLLSGLLPADTNTFLARLSMMLLSNVYCFKYIYINEELVLCSKKSFLVINLTWTSSSFLLRSSKVYKKQWEKTKGSFNCHPAWFRKTTTTKDMLRLWNKLWRRHPLMLPGPFANPSPNTEFILFQGSL